MKINFAPTFEDSLDKLIMQQSWWYKTYEFFRYDIPRFIKNVWRFRKALSRHRWYDHHGSLMFLEIGLTHMSDNIEKHGLEVDESRLKKVTAMRRTIELIKNYNESNYIDIAEKELGELFLFDWEFEPVPDKPGYHRLIDDVTSEEKEHNNKVFARAREIEKEQWDELFVLLKGQDYSKFDDNIDWEKQFDGSGIRGWWD
jgi:hypothetical protein